MYAHVRARAEEGVPPMAALGVAILAVSTSAILVVWSEAPSVVAAFYRVLFTVLLLAPFALTHHRSEMRALSMRDGIIAFLAGVALAIHFAAWFESLNWTSVAASLALVQSQPLFVAIGAAFFLGERLTRTIIAGMAVAVGGITIMSAGDLLGVGGLGPNPLLGNSLALLGAITVAGYVLVGRSLRQRVPLLPYVTVVYSACAGVLLLIVLAQGHPLSGYPGREWLLFLAMAVGPGVFGHTVINWALARVESSVVSVTLLGEPVGGSLLAVILLGEIPPPPTIIGGAVVLAGIYLTVRGRPDG